MTPRARAATQRGATGRLSDMHDDGASVLALDIGATKTLLAVAPVASQAAGRTTWERGVAIRIPSDRDPAALIDRIATTAYAAAAGRAIVAVGCAVPGPLDRATGTVLHSPNLGWHDLPLVALLRDRLGVPVALDDDASAGALGEWRFGAGRGTDPFAYLTVSSGVGAGLVIGGRSFHGAHDLAGEVGHLTIDPAGPRCACGRRGDVEAFAGGSSLARRARAAWPRGSVVAGRPAPVDADGVFRAARAGDPIAAVLFDEAAEALGRAIAALAAALDPARVAVGGAIALGQPALVRRATAIARRRCIAEMGRRLEVVPAALGEESVLAGAAVLGEAMLRPA